MLSSYLDPDSNFESRLLCGKYVVEGELNNQSSIANNGDVFSIMHINARSLLKSLDKLKLIMMNMQTPPSVICVTETCLNDATSELVNIIGHNYISNHRRISKSGGGVGVYGLIQNMDHPCGPGPWTPSRTWSMNYPCGPPLVLRPGLTLIRCTPNLTSNKKCPLSLSICYLFSTIRKG